MIKEASFCPSSSCRPSLHARKTSVPGSLRFWMRTLSGSRALSNLAAYEISHSQASNNVSLCSVNGLPSERYPPLKYKFPPNLLCYAQFPRSNLKHSRSRGSTRSRLVKVEVAGLDFNSFSEREQPVYLPEGPSCIYVGPLEKAEKTRLEALYQQARDSYYSGSPLIVDDMFDRVETMLRWHGSKLVMKYPRCSLKRFSAYSDAEIDSSQMWALASIWGLIFASGIVTAAGPSVCAFNKACQKSVHLRFESHGVSAATETVMYMNGLLAISMGLAIGIPITVAAARSLQGLWRGDLVAMKGCCPSCGEEVYAFVRADQSGQPQHKTECHVCEHPLMFRANVERSSSNPNQLWAYGRVYLSTQSKDLIPDRHKV
ncbi:hypothetical protein MPTK1_3g13050 [Marchantia polymorpha subsp. ruderalis]|uniref:PGR5-like protein 1B, chloroplastic n=2 Tax=Marchantia polymorpha TaxID=3197 RepID=A0AAF6B097_MARPO|nr:hypothetical protein MARPO_0050s0097 [Marchantia polymorpha]BBN05431.1 hypothetical protein Mp_3g13050 [Marchantia polymorpha subsp. ruderalis]|eukprot:PTQ38644.1 hypothetical protein MARPO_0050s0097 [Marchantia polymorpha]